MKIVNIINEVADKRQQKRRVDIEGIMIHRCGLDHETGVVLGYDAISICDAFTGRASQWREVARATGGQNPYTFLIGGNCGPAKFDGQIWQALPIWEVGHHARRFSRPFLGIACIGDFRSKLPSDKQIEALYWLCGRLIVVLELSANHIHGHGEVRGAHGGNKAPGKPAACPGGLLSITSVRVEANRYIYEAIPEEAKLDLLTADAELSW